MQRGRLLTPILTILPVVVLFAGCPTEPVPGGGGVSPGKYIVLGYNDLGMHCMNQDFSTLMILPPYNTLHAQVIERRGEEPRIVSSGVTVEYSIPGNTDSTDDTNFWDYAPALFGIASLPANIGLTGHGLSGTMSPTGDNDWSVTGIPITPIDDDGNENAYQLSKIVVKAAGQEVASTQAVVPVSWEISCDLCHVPNTGETVDMDILRDHDRLHSTHLVDNTPVMCGSCHAQAPLGTTGAPGVPSLSHAMHSSHATRMASANLAVNCYACHPGVRTQCLRDIHLANGKDCLDCHGDMNAVGDSSRSPWVDEPRCGDCHTRQGFEFEQPGKLYRESKGHHGVHCAACHGSPHAITPTVTDADNVQAIAIQGHAGTIDKCSVCHTETPDDEFDHRFEGDEDEEEDDKAILASAGV